MNYAVRIVSIFAAFAVLFNFATYWSGGIVQGFTYALLGGFGNTIPALLVVVTAAIGLFRDILNSSESIGVFFAKKFLFLVYSMGIVFSVFANGTLIYLKLEKTANPENIYIQILGSPILEILMIVTIIVPMFIGKSKPIREK